MYQLPVYKVLALGTFKMFWSSKRLHQRDSTTDTRTFPTVSSRTHFHHVRKGVHIFQWDANGIGLLFFIHNSVSFTHKPLSTTSKNNPHLKELSASIAMDNTKLHITNMYIPPSSSCNGCYPPALDHMLIGTYSLVLGDFNSHHSLWHAGTPEQPIREATNWRIQLAFPALPS